MNEKSCRADVNNEATAKDDDSGTEGGRDATILEQTIAYEARSDESKREFLATMHRLLCDGAVRIQSIRVSTLAAIDEGLRLANRTNTAYTLASRVHSVEASKPIAIVDRRLCVEAALAAAWAQIGETLTATIQEALEKGSDEYNSALELHATRTHLRVHALKEAHAQRLATHRRATAAAAADREAKFGLRIEAIKAESRQELRNVLAKSERQHVEELEYVMAREQKVDRKLVLTQAELDSERRAVTNLRQEITALLDTTLNGDDAVSEELARIDNLLALTGYDKRQALKRRLLVPIESVEPSQLGNSTCPGLSLQKSLPKRGCQKSSSASVDAAISLHPDKYWLLKSEIVRLRSKMSSLEKDVELAKSNSREALVASVESKRERGELEKQLNDALKKYNVLKNAQRESSQQLSEPCAKVANGSISQASSRDTESKKKAHHNGYQKRVKKHIGSVIKRVATEGLHGSDRDLGDELLSGAEDLAAQVSSCAPSDFNNEPVYTHAHSVTYPATIKEVKRQGEGKLRQKHSHKVPQKIEREKIAVASTLDQSSLGITDSFRPSSTGGTTGFDDCLAAETKCTPVAESAAKTAEDEMSLDVKVPSETRTSCSVMQTQPWKSKAVLVVEEQPGADAKPNDRRFEASVHHTTVNYPVATSDANNDESYCPGVKPAFEDMPHCCVPAPNSENFNRQSIVAVALNASAANGSRTPALLNSTERSPSGLVCCAPAIPEPKRGPRDHEIEQTPEPAKTEFIGAQRARTAQDEDSKPVGFVHDNASSTLPAMGPSPLKANEKEVENRLVGKSSQFKRMRPHLESQVSSHSPVHDNSKSIAHLTMELERESNAVAHARAEVAKLYSNTTALKQRVAKLELVIAEKNAIVREMTLLARSHREKAIDAEARLKQLRSYDETRYVLDSNMASAPHSEVPRSRSSPTYYQHGPAQMTTRLRQPVTGEVIYVKAPIRQAPQHQSRPIAVSGLKSEVRKAIASAVSSALDPAVVSASVPRDYLQRADISASSVRKLSRISAHDN